MVAVRIEWPFPVTIASVYIPNGKIDNLLNKLAKILEKLPAPMLILGDVNGYHSSWGSRSDNTRGNIIFNAATDAVRSRTDSNSTFRVQLGASSSRTVTEETGVPQGSVIAVTLFLVAMEGVFSNLPKEIHILVYADDIVLVVIGKRLKALRRKAQAAVRKVAEWAQASGYEMASQQVRVHVCDTNHRLPDQPITINGSTIPAKHSVKLLGITVDRHLNFKRHFEATHNACKSRVNMIKLISRKRTRSDRATRIRVADAVINSRLTYGIELTSCNFPELVRNLAPVYNRSIRSISGLLPSTPADIACAEAGVLPFRYKAALALCTRTVGYLEKTKTADGTCSLLDRANEDLQQQCQLKLPAGLHRLGARPWDSTKANIDMSLKNTLRTGLSSHTIRYTDGSKAAGKVGIGIETDEGNSASYRQPNSCSVFTAEVAAIFQAITLPSPNPTVIVTDSASALSAIAAESNRHPFVQAVQQALNPNFTLMWVPGHAGIQGNENADVLAATGRSSPYICRSIPQMTPNYGSKTK
ncbi:uncharacterized protein LOC134203799 [Armigeres subalbatus]|uniref:uncharacterized protein LOC134203799 n=1 Tax=Armigeres subalbatus TaxID=124917 RepID=UPI002ED08CF9